MTIARDVDGISRQIFDDATDADLSARLREAPGWTVALLTPDPAWVELAVDERLGFSSGGGAVTLSVGHT